MKLASCWKWNDTPHVGRGLYCLRQIGKRGSLVQNGWIKTLKKIFPKQKVITFLSMNIHANVSQFERYRQQQQKIFEMCLGARSCYLLLEDVNFAAFTVHRKNAQREWVRQKSWNAIPQLCS
jgi:hypothetical protein